MIELAMNIVAFCIIALAVVVSIPIILLVGLGVVCFFVWLLVSFINFMIGEDKDKGEDEGVHNEPNRRI